MYALEEGWEAGRAPYLDELCHHADDVTAFYQEYHTLMNSVTTLMASHHAIGKGAPYLEW
jgi:hypothetical protein